MEAIEKKLIDIMGDCSLSCLNKASRRWRVLGEGAEPARRHHLMRLVLESFGLVPRHGTSVKEGEGDIDDALIAALRKRFAAKIEYQMKGWFEINIDWPVEKTMAEICRYLDELGDETEKAVVFEMILSSSHVPIPVNYFSRFVDDPEGDELILRQHAISYIKLRQLLNLQAGPTTRGSLMDEFMLELKDDARARDVVLGAFVGELLRRLRDIARSGSAQAQTKVITLPLNMKNGDMDEMIRNMRNILPPEVLDQLKKLFNHDDPPDEES
ncbi:MAG: hypothetical protein HQL31_06815 [Planctomycetes bacterium]|nr:hypothetical protein [Planctomycetota bacterium]